MVVLLLFAFLAGIVTVLSPCILPILPLLLAAGIGSSIYRPLGVIVGLVCSFSLFTLALTALVQSTGISPEILRYSAIGLILFFGLTMLFPSLSNYFAQYTAGIATLGQTIQETSSRAKTGFLSGFFLGIALGLLWTPCAGPILATIITLVATNKLTWHAALLIVVYSIGAAIPMFLIAYGSSKIVSSTRVLASYSELIRKVFGTLMIVGALAIAFHWDVALQQLTVQYFPSAIIDDTHLVHKELESLMPGKILGGKQSMKIHDGVIHAPDFKGIEHWINTKPLTMKDLRGKVVLIDFWTYSCINCIRTLPYLKQLYTSYKDQGFVLVGVHAPEFAFEKVVSNVEDAVRRFDITYPVAMDNAYQTWLAYDNHYWPAHYLIDQNGIIRYTHFGEGEYTTTENKIRQLLGLAPLPADGEREIYKSLTPEMYLGYERAHSYQTGITIQPGKTKHYEYTGQLGIDEVGITGSWFVDSQFIKSAHDDAQLLLNFVANRVYLVMQSADQKNIKVLLDGKPLPSIYYTKDINDQGEMSVHKARMYDIIDLKGDYGRHILTLQVPEGVSLYAFTFGGSADELTNK